MRIGLVDDQVAFRQILRRICEQEWRFSVIVEAGTAAEAAAELTLHPPDLVLLDLYLPDATGFQVVEHVKTRAPNVRFLALSGYCDDMTVVQVLKFGIQGFLYKAQSDMNEIHAAIDVVAAGGTYYSRQFMRTREAQQSNPGFFAKTLSDREFAVLSLIGEGRKDGEIAVRMGISLRTVEKHKSNLLHKLRLENTSALILFAAEHGLIHRS